DAARVVEQQCTFSIPDELRYLTGESSVGNADSFDRERLFSRKCHAFLLPNNFECNSPSKGAACRGLPLLRYSCRFMPASGFSAVKWWPTEEACDESGEA